MIAGFERPDRGEVFVEDRCIVSVQNKLFLPPERREMGMVFQSYAIWPHMNVLENVSYPLRLRRMKESEIREKVAAVLELVGLSGLEKRPAMLLSGGQSVVIGLSGDEGAYIRCDTIDGKMKYGDPVVIAIRPEEVKLSMQKEGESFNQLPCRVETAVFLGDRYECQLRFGATAFTLPTTRAEAISAGQKVCLKLSPDSVRIWRKDGFPSEQ